MQRSWMALTITTAVCSCFIMLSHLGIQGVSRPKTALNVEYGPCHPKARALSTSWGEGQRSTRRINVRSQR